AGAAGQLRELLRHSGEQSASAGAIWRELDELERTAGSGADAVAQLAAGSGRLLAEAATVASPLLRAAGAILLSHALDDGEPGQAARLGPLVDELRQCGPTAVECRVVADLCHHAMDAGADVELADRALDLLRTGLDGPEPLPDHERADLLALTAYLHRQRYLREHEAEDLRRALAAIDEADTLAGPGHPDADVIRDGRVSIHEMLSGPATTGSDRRAIFEDPSAAPEMRARSALGIVQELITRYQTRGDSAALEEAVDLAEEALRLHPGPDDRLWWRLMRAAQPYALLGWHISDPAKLDRAVELSGQALALLPADHPAAAGLLNEFGSELHMRSALAGPEEGMTGLREAIHLLRRSAELTPPRSDDHAPFVTNFVMSLWTWWKFTEDERVLDEAIPAAEAALAALDGNPAAERHRARLRTVLATLISLRDKGRPADEATGAKVSDLLRESMAEGNWTNVRVMSGRLGLVLAAAAKDWAGAADIGRQAIGLMPHVTSEALRMTDREYGLAEWAADLARDTCACALSAGRPDEALTLLEQGRAALLGQALSGRRNHDLDQVRALAPRLADELAGLRAELAEAESAMSAGGAAERRHALAARIEELTREVRAVPGLERYLLPPDLAGLRAGLRTGPGAGQAPVVVLNVSGYRCDALVLRPDDDEVPAIRLPKLDAAEAGRRAADFAAAVAALTPPDIRDRPGPRDGRRLHGVVDDTLAWLWEAAVGPVLDALGGAVPRVRWSPTGALTQLPLHAAGERGERAMDRVASSYVPTLRLAAPGAAAAQPRRGTLVVSVPRPRSAAGEQPLDRAAEEAARLAGRLPDAELLDGERAGTRAVLDALGRSRAAHFACHGVNDPESTSRSHLLLHDEPLTVAELMRQRLDGVGLVVLSACHTARGSDRLPDEVLHLASAFQAAGARHAVGSLWRVGDEEAEEFSRVLYDELGSDGRSPADADGACVAAAVDAGARAVRESSPAVVSWAPFIHAGF
ncbi:CHAT domain-containing protein, partial [Streptomyces sp. A7024]